MKNILACIGAITLITLLLIAIAEIRCRTVKKKQKERKNDN